MKTKLFLTGLALLACSLSFAQTDDVKVAAALSKSYESEFANKYPAAIETLSKVYDEKSYFLNLRMGWLNYLAGDQKKSVDFYRQALVVAPRSIEARMGLVYPLSVMGNWDEIINVYNEVLKLDPANSVVNFRMGLISFNKKEYTKAQAYCLKVLELYPYDYDSNLLLGRIYIANGKNSDAKPVLNRALQFNPQSKEAAELLKKS